MKTTSKATVRRHPVEGNKIVNRLSAPRRSQTSISVYMVKGLTDEQVHLAVSSILAVLPRGVRPEINVRHHYSSLTKGSP